MLSAVTSRKRKMTSEPKGSGRVLPCGVKPEKDYSIGLSSICIKKHFIKGRQHANTFDVKAEHKKLRSSSGVRFNVESVPSALKEDFNKARLNDDNILESMKQTASAFYGNKYGTSAFDIRVEALSDTPDTVAFYGGSGFFAACLTAFAQHLPLALSPDHLWSVISYAFAKHVDKHAEELRKNFVEHDGKKMLEVVADHLVMGGGDLTVGSGPKVWQETIFPDFSRQIREHIGEKVHDIIASGFSTTTNSARAAHEITLMAAMKNYFSYSVTTRCGIPDIRLLGEEEDWVALRARAQDLGELMTDEFKNAWMPYLLPVFDEFVNSYRGDVNHGFWQSMVKLRSTGDGSGSHDFISGWIQILFPYLKDGSFNSRLRPWNEMYFTGPEPDEFPAIVSSAPVNWDYYGDSFDMHFHAGISGYTQDPDDGTLTPLIGWFITHDPPKDPDVRLEEVKGEIESLLKGHAAEAQAHPVDRNTPWYKRVWTLYTEQIALLGPALRIEFQRRLEKESLSMEQYFAIRKEMGDIEQTIQDQRKQSLSLDDYIKAIARA